MAFQCIVVSPGQHVLEFRYRSRWLVLGGAISFCSMLLLAMLIRDGKIGKRRTNAMVA